jgi:hypothetical protein
MPSRDPFRDELESTLKQKGCAICRISKHGVTRFLDQMLYDMVNDPDVRRDVRASFGFCKRHTWGMRGMHGNSLGLRFLHEVAGADDCI